MITAPPTQPSNGSTLARSDGVIRERIAYERVEAMIRTTPFPLLVGLAFAATCAVVLLRETSAEAVVLWFAVLTVLTGLRVLHTRRFDADVQRQARAGYWERSYLLLLLPHGLAWTAMLALANPHIGSFTFSYVVVGLLGVASVGVYTTHSVFHASAAWLLSITLPVAAWCLWRGGIDGVVLALGTLLFAGVMVHESLRSSRLLTEMLRLRLENAAIADDRARALALAEQSSRAKTRFLATISHEMRTPLNGIMGISELMRDEARDAQLRQRAEIVLRSSELLNRVIGDLLDLSRLEFGRLSLELAPFNPAQVLRDVLALAAPVAVERGLVLDLEVAPAVPRYVSGDVARVKQVLHNLLSNALRFSHAGRISATLVPSSQGLLYTVSDTGPGMEPARLADIFEPLDHGDVELERQPQGVGLSLSISRRLARAMNGDLTCESEPGRGSCFFFTLQAPVVGEPADRDDVEPPTPLFAGRVLVVDDNDVNALVAQAMLARLGLPSDIALDGEQALEKMSLAQHDMVLMDCRMPKLDGWSATSRWRDREFLQGGTQRLPIIGVTANVSDADRLHCLQSGMDGFLPKPFRIHELADAVARHLKATSASGTTAPAANGQSAA
jgi:signal transduction histidine kinase/CheY-like chemotaxis protein